MTIIGVVPAIRYFPLGAKRRPSIDPGGTEQVYFPLQQHPRTAFYIAARFSLDHPGSLMDTVRKRIWSLNGSVPITNASSMEAILYSFKERPRLTMALLVPLALVTLVLSLIGIYSVVSYTLERMRPEIAVRIALGAHGTDVLRFLLTNTVLVLAVGGGIGFVVSIAVSEFVSSLLQIRPGNSKPAGTVRLAGVRCHGN